jgi:uncharacterized membrane protein (UPF0127 family)
MKQVRLGFVCLGIVLLFLGLDYWFSDKTTMIPCDQTVVTTNSGQAIPAEIADTPSKRAKGLAFRDSLTAKTGMLFLFSRSAIYPFWMKDTHIPLDIIWMNNKIIVEIASLPPASATRIPQHEPTHEANAVLELNQGEAALLGLNLGSQLTWSTCENLTP